MARNITTVTVYQAEWHGAWVVRRFEEQGYQGYAVSTLARDLVNMGWRELGDANVKMAFPRAKAFGDVPVERVFVRSDGQGPGRMLVLTKGKW